MRDMILCRAKGSSVMKLALASPRPGLHRSSGGRGMHPCRSQGMKSPQACHQGTWHAAAKEAIPRHNQPALLAFFAASIAAPCSCSIEVRPDSVTHIEWDASSLVTHANCDSLLVAAHYDLHRTTFHLGRRFRIYGSCMKAILQQLNHDVSQIARDVAK